MEKININMEQLNDKLSIVTAELSNERKNNQILTNSVKDTLDNFRNLKYDLSTQDGIPYKEKLDITSKELKKVVEEKNNIQKR